MGAKEQQFDNMLLRVCLGRLEGDKSEGKFMAYQLSAIDVMESAI